MAGTGTLGRSPAVQERCQERAMLRKSFVGKEPWRMEDRGKRHGGATFKAGTPQTLVLQLSAQLMAIPIREVRHRRWTTLNRAIIMIQKWLHRPSSHRYLHPPPASEAPTLNPYKRTINSPTCFAPELRRDWQPCLTEPIS